MLTNGLNSEIINCDQVLASFTVFPKADQGLSDRDRVPLAFHTITYDLNLQLNGHGDSTPSATTNNGHLSHPSPLDGGGVEVHGNGWPEGTTMHLPAPSTTTTKGAAAGKCE